VLGPSFPRLIRHSPPSISFQCPRALYSHARGVLRGAFGEGGNPVLSLDLSFPFPVRLSAQQLAVY
jgi:preprotein translocase subunit SecB